MEVTQVLECPNIAERRQFSSSSLLGSNISLPILVALPVVHDHTGDEAQGIASKENAMSEEKSRRLPILQRLRQKIGFFA